MLLLSLNHRQKTSLHVLVAEGQADANVLGNLLASGMSWPQIIQKQLTAYCSPFPSLKKGKSLRNILKSTLHMTKWMKVPWLYIDMVVPELRHWGAGVKKKSPPLPMDFWEALSLLQVQAGKSVLVFFSWCYVCEKEKWKRQTDEWINGQRERAHNNQLI